MSVWTAIGSVMATVALVEAWAAVHSHHAEKVIHGLAAALFAVMAIGFLMGG